MNWTMALSLFSTLANGTMPASLLPKEQEIDRWRYCTRFASRKQMNDIPFRLQIIVDVRMFSTTATKAINLFIALTS
jgi:hypothetical protein